MLVFLFRAIGPWTCSLHRIKKTKHVFGTPSHDVIISTPPPRSCELPTVKTAPEAIAELRAA